MTEMQLKEIGSRIELFRKQHNPKLTQTSFGEPLGLSRGAINNLERGVNTHPEVYLRLICSTYHINYLWLTEGDGPMIEAMNTDDLVDLYMAGESEVTRSIMKAFAKLPDEEWVKLRELIERIKKEGR